MLGGGKSAKSRQMQTRGGDVQLKVDVHLEEIYIPYFLKYAQSDNLPGVCWRHYSWIFVIRALSLVDCGGANYPYWHRPLSSNGQLSVFSEPDSFSCVPNWPFVCSCEPNCTVHCINTFDLSSNLHSISIQTFYTL